MKQLRTFGRIFMGLLRELSDENAYRLTMAVAGFGEDELDVTANANRLVVSGRKDNGKPEDSKFLHRGIATRAFERKFVLLRRIFLVLEIGILGAIGYFLGTLFGG